jgi:hypothetical protein
VKVAVHARALAVAASLAASGCMVGPEYVRPPAPAANMWLESGDATVHTAAAASARYVSIRAIDERLAVALRF